MMDLTGTFGTIIALAIVVIGFGAIIFVHELGHFLAAKWAGIRVLAFAVGFGPAVLSFRKGMGVRVGSSEKDYIELLKKQGSDSAPSPSATEYRLNVLPFGGYVKMLGQEDLKPDAVSSASDSYQNCLPWKRMVVISAGVVMNMITAAMLFVIVFMAGLSTEPPVVGSVVRGLPASRAVAYNAAELGVVEPGLLPGDRLVEINGRIPNSFNDVMLASAMARRGHAVQIVVERDGVAAPLEFEIKPEPGPLSQLLEIGVDPMRSATIVSGRNDQEHEFIALSLSEIGLKGVKPGMTMVRVGENSDVQTAEDLFQAIRDSQGEPVEIEFRGEDGQRVVSTLKPQPALEHDMLPRDKRTFADVTHLLGLTPVMTVVQATDRPAYDKGLRDGDIFVRIGAVEYPSLAQGIGEVRRHKGTKVDVVVLRETEDGSGVEEVSLQPAVSRKGMIGFLPGEGVDETLLAMPPLRLVRIRDGAKPYEPAAAGLITQPGTRVVSIDGQAVTSFFSIREAMRAATFQAYSAGLETFELRIGIRPPGGFGVARPPAVETVSWELSRGDLESLHDLGWTSPVGVGAFELERYTLIADGPAEAIGMGLKETHRVMMSTYLTFARLFEGTVKVEHLKGPVGIAHLGTQIVQQGMIKLLFFLALVSVNLAVVNFLPLPIVDGGQFIFLLVEQARGRPVSIAIQNVATLAGIVFIASIFLIVTFNDIMGLIGR